MTAENFLSTVSNGADGVAGDGRRKWVRYTDDNRRNNRLSYRLAHETRALEYTLINNIWKAVHSQRVDLPRACIADYYISLKTTSFVVLNEGAAEAKSAVAQAVAEALVGTNGSQCVQISGGASWPQGTGEGRYYRSLLERFDALRFLELLHDAAAPSNAGKAYFLYLDGLHADEVNHFFSSMLRWNSDGEKRLALPGIAPEQQPVVPRNVYITANVHTIDDHYPLSQQALRYANIVSLPSHGKADWTPSAPARRIPPVGYQRVMLESAIHDMDTARSKLRMILGDDHVAALGPSTELMRIVWRGGLVVSNRTLYDLTCYVANSFDASGIGLFDQNDPLRNAQIALDIHTIRRIVSFLNHTPDTSFRGDVVEYRAKLLAEASGQGC